MSKMWRWLSLVLVSCCLTLSACSKSKEGAGTAPPPPPMELAVLEWAGYDAKDFWIDFSNKNPTAKVSFEIGSSDADVYGKMKGGAKADIFHAYTGWLQFYVDEGLVEEIDVSKLSNWSKVPENFRTIGQIQRQAVFRPLGLGLHLHSLSNRQGQEEDRFLVGAARPGIQGTHFHLGRWTGHGDGLLVHSRLRRNQHQPPSSWPRSRRSGSSSVR